MRTHRLLRLLRGGLDDDQAVAVLYISAGAAVIAGAVAGLVVSLDRPRPSVVQPTPLRATTGPAAVASPEAVDGQA